MTKEELVEFETTVDDVVKQDCLYEPLVIDTVIKAIYDLEQKLPGWTIGYKPFFGPKDNPDPTGKEHNSAEFLFYKDGEARVLHVGPKMNGWTKLD